VQGAAKDTEGVEKHSKLLSGFAGPGAPGAIFKADEHGQKVAGRQVIGVVLAMKNSPNVAQQLEGEAALREVSKIDALG